MIELVSNWERDYQYWFFLLPELPSGFRSVDRLLGD